MTVAVVVKVFDGVVLATDSATTFSLDNGSAQVYNSANKIFHLHRGLPIGAMTWGLGNIGDASISTLAKDLRGRLMGKVPEYLDWKLGDEYTIEQVAQRLVEMFHAELYAPESSGNDSPPVLGMFVAGYSAHARQAEGWLVTLDSATTAPLPQLAIPFDAAGWIAYAQPEATTRLFNGFDPQLLQQLAQSLPPESQGGLQEAADAAKRMPVVPAMPFMDAISLAKFLVDVTIGYSHYLLGPDTVGGLVEVAGISRHEGFKWVHRKHYYSPSLNPEEPR